VSIELSHVHDTISKHFPSLWTAVEAGLSTCATLLLADNANPVALIYVGPPSAGKTTVASMFDGAEVDGQPICYRSDKFTHAAFVSQSAKVNEAALKKIDLLPKIRHKVLLTPELGTIFRGKQDDLIERFSVITRVLDGQGFVTDSGTHGQRGYKGDYLFAWIGCTTPFDPIVWRVMAQLGSRLFFLIMDAAAEPTVEELVAGLKQSVPYKESLSECTVALHHFVDALFRDRGGVRAVRWDTEKNPEAVVKKIAQCAALLALLRTPHDPNVTVQPESPRRANAVLYNLARGHALISGRTHLEEDDLALVARVTLASIPEKRRAALLVLLRHDEEVVTVAQVQAGTGVSQHTAESIVKEFEWLGIVTFDRPGQGKKATIKLRPEWAWIKDKAFADLLLKSNLAEIRGCVSVT
jgi:hypothetical protein